MRTYGFVSVIATKALALVRIAYPSAKITRIGPDRFSVCEYSDTIPDETKTPFNVVVINNTVIREEISDGQDS